MKQRGDPILAVGLQREGNRLDSGIDLWRLKRLTLAKICFLTIPAAPGLPIVVGAIDPILNKRSKILDGYEVNVTNPVPSFNQQKRPPRVFARGGFFGNSNFY